MKHQFIKWFISDYIEIIKFIKQLKEKQRIKRIVNKKFVIKKYNN